MVNEVDLVNWKKEDIQPYVDVSVTVYTVRR
jgi:hypothetical protein